MSQDKKQARCPTCNKAFTWDPTSPWRPFCSQRCRLIDLGEWLDEAYRIPDSSDSQPSMPPDKKS